MNRVKCACIAKGRSLPEIARILNIDLSTILKFENPIAPIDIDMANRIAKILNVSPYFICGKNYRITRQKSDWLADEKEDYDNMTPEGQEFLYFTYGKGIFTEAATLETPIIEDIKIAIVDGKDDDNEMLDVVLTYTESKEVETNQNDDNPKT